jgi:uncharacterized protein YcbK (DUF882 family)
MKLSNNFKLNELIYSSTAEVNRINNYPSPVEIDNLRALCENILQPIRDKWGSPLYVNSGYRSPILNRKVGGVPTSYHCSGNAVDITTKDVNKNKELFKMIVEMIKNKEITVGELIDESRYSWLHISNPVKEENQILHLGW